MPSCFAFKKQVVTFECINSRDAFSLGQTQNICHINNMSVYVQ